MKSEEPATFAKWYLLEAQGELELGREDSDHRDGEKWSNSGCILKINLTAFPKRRYIRNVRKSRHVP